MPEDIIVLLINLLEAQWNPANTLSQTPQVHSGYHTLSKGPFQVILRTTPNEFALGGSGVAGMQSDGKPVQLIRGLVFLDVVAERVEDGAVNPEGLSFLGKQEVQRIVMENYSNITDYDYISFEGANKIVPRVEERPDLFKWQARVGFQWRYNVA